MKPIRIGVIDSGFPDAKKNYMVYEDHIHESENDFDKLFHGLGVSTIITDFSNNVELLNFKVFFNDLECNETVLIKAIEGCIKEKVDIINISVGYDIYSSRLKRVCEKAKHQGIIIVAAKETAIGITYPADFENVIRVIGDERYKYGMWSVDSGDVYACKNWDLKIRSKFIFFSGSSFACAFVTAVIANYMIEHEKPLYKEVIDHITLYAGRVGLVENLQREDRVLKADLYPINRSSSCILKHSDLLQRIDIVNIYAQKGHGLKNKSLNEAFNIGALTQTIIEGIENIATSESDSIIVFGLSPKSDGDVGCIKYVLDICLDNNKDIIYLDEFPGQLMYLYSAKAVKKMHYILTNVWYRLERVDVATQANITAIISTSNSNSVINIEAALLRSLRGKTNRFVSFIASSPVAILWGLETHNAAFSGDISSKARFEIAEKYRYNSKIAVVGIPHPVLKWNSTYHKMHDEIRGLEELIAVNPSSIIMNINASDPIEYIEDTINILMSVLGLKPQVIVIGECSYDSETYVDNTLLYLPVSKKHMLDRCKFVQKVTGIPCCILENSSNKLLKCIMQ